MKALDAYLSRKAQAVCPTALVYRIEENGTTRYDLERKVGETLCLGFQFGEAKAGIDAFVKAEKARQEPHDSAKK